MKISGIYKIINKINGKYYVGSSQDIPRRWYIHRLNLLKKSHDNIYLQRAWDKYGEASFDFIVIKLSNKKFLLSKEQTYLTKASKERSQCYNLTYTAGGGNLGEVVNKKISTSLKGKMVGKKNPFYGMGHTMTGYNNHFFRKHHSNKTKIAISTHKKSQGAWNGIKNPKHNNIFYTFKNIITNELFRGTTFEFRSRFKNITPTGTWLLTKNKRLKYKNWIIYH